MSIRPKIQTLDFSNSGKLNIQNESITPNQNLRMLQNRIPCHVTTNKLIAMSNAEIIEFDL